MPVTSAPWVHDLFVALGIAAALWVFVAEKRRRGLDDDRLWVILGFAVGWGAVAARLGTWTAQLAQPGQVERAGLLEQFLYGNRSILGGLLGAYLGVLVAKRLTGYRGSTGALFTPAAALGMAIGRVGCALTEPPGTATSLPWAVTPSAEVARELGVPLGVGLHPSYVYEVLFHAVAFVVVWRYRDRLAPSDLFVLWVSAYAIFRFAVEFVRVGDRLWLGLTGPQLLLALTLPFLLARLRRRRRPLLGVLPHPTTAHAAPTDARGLISKERP